MIYRAAQRNNLVGFGSWAPKHVESYFPVYTMPPQGLGMTFTISTPVGSKSISVPVREIAEKTAQIALDAAWPIAQQKLRQAIPGLIDQAIVAAEPHVPVLTKKAVAAAKPDVDRIVDKATSRAAMIATGIALVMVGTAWWTRRAVKKGR